MKLLTKWEQKFLNEPECSLWPDCCCRENLERWQAKLLDEEQTFTPETLEWAEEVLWATCACIEAHCPDPKIRVYGARQFASLDRRRRRKMSAQRRAELQ